VTRADRRAGRLLALAAAAGIAGGALAATFARPGRGALPAGAIAAVNGVPIRSDDFERALELYAADRRTPLGEADRAHVLGRLIDEELLVQHGLASGLLDSERSLRELVVRAMVDSIAAESASRAPGADELRALYDEAARAAAAEGAALPPLEAARAELEAIVAERALAAALRAYLEELRAAARIERAEDAGR
jgi:hypothetical protein